MVRGRMACSEMYALIYRRTRALVRASHPLLTSLRRFDSPDWASHVIISRSSSADPNQITKYSIFPVEVFEIPDITCG